MITVMRPGSQPGSTGSAENFTGEVSVVSRFQQQAPARIGGAIVTFQAGARTNWHTHPLGQTLLVTLGSGRVQQWGGPVEAIEAGDIVWIPPGVKHWHGAGPSGAMTHFAVSEALEEESAEWLEKVTDDQYLKAEGSSHGQS